MNRDIIVKDATVASALAKDGFTVVSMIDNNQIKELFELYQKYFASKLQINKYNLDSNADSSPDIKGKISEAIQKIFKPAIDTIFENYEFLPAIFFIKKPGANSQVTLHQDPTLLIDESENSHINLWCPLLDVDENNGALQMIKGSQIFSPPVSAATIPYYFSKTEEVLYEAKECVRMKAGESLVFDNRTIHGSMPNLSSKTRVAAILSMVAPNRQFISLYRDPNVKNASIEVYFQENDWYMHPLWSNNQNRPKIGKKAGILDYEPFFLNKEEMTDLIRNPRPYKEYRYRIVSEKKYIFSWLQKLFSTQD